MTKKLYIFFFIFISASQIHAQLTDWQIERISTNMDLYENRISLSDEIAIEYRIKRFLEIKYDSCKYDFIIEELSHEYVDSDYKLYSIYRDGKLCPNDTRKVIHSSTRRFDEYFLIGINQKLKDGDDKKIKYFSGFFFTNNISYDYEDLDIKRPETYLDYISLRLHQYKVSDIVFDKKKGKELYFSARTIYSKNKIDLIVDTETWNNHITINWH